MKARILGNSIGVGALAVLLFGVTTVTYAQPTTGPQTPPPPGMGPAPRADTETANQPTSGAKEKKKPEKVTTGVIAGYGDYGIDASVPAANTSAPGEDPSAIGGSASKLGNGQCQAVVMNNAKETSYSIAFAVQGFDIKGNKTSYRSWAASIKPGQKITREYTCNDNEARFQVNLKSAKPLK